MLLLKKHKINYLGLLLFIVLFSIFTYSFCEIIIKSPIKAYHHKLSSLSFNGIVINKIQQPYYYKTWLPQFDNSNFKVITKHIKLLTNDRLIQQIISSFQKTELSLIPVKPPGFYYHFYLRDTEDLPVLS
jgi:hypothetical protein